MDEDKRWTLCAGCLKREKTRRTSCVHTCRHPVRSRDEKRVETRGWTWEVRALKSPWGVDENDSSSISISRSTNVKRFGGWFHQTTNNSPMPKALQENKNPAKEICSCSPSTCQPLEPAPRAGRGILVVLLTTPSRNPWDVEVIQGERASERAERERHMATTTRGGQRHPVNN